MSVSNFADKIVLLFIQGLELRPHLKTSKRLMKGSPVSLSWRPSGAICLYRLAKHVTSVILWCHKYIQLLKTVGPSDRGV